MLNNNRQQAQYVTTGDPETVSDDLSRAGTQSLRGQLGNYVIIQQPGAINQSGEGQVEANRNKTYRYVQSDSTMTVAPFPGAVAYWKDKSRMMVTTSPTAEAQSRRAGVFQGSPTKGHGCFIQTGGPGTVKFVDGVAGGSPWVTKGLWVVPSATAGKADTVAAGTAPGYPTLGLSMGSGNAAAAEAVVDLDIPDTP